LSTGRWPAQWSNPNTAALTHRHKLVPAIQTSRRYWPIGPIGRLAGAVGLVSNADHLEMV
jgi:hypothetical protein